MSSSLAWRSCQRRTIWARRWAQAGLGDAMLAKRGIHASRPTAVKRLLWAGSILDQQSAALREVPKDWLLAMGARDDVEQGISITGLAASPSHFLVSYETLAPSLPVQANASEQDDELKPQLNPVGLHKIAAMGRNTYGELGLGFSSQESTWGLVSRGFDGAGGIRSMQCGLGSSWVATNEDKSDTSRSNVYAFGNHTSGQLGLGGPSRAHALSEGGEPQLELYSSPRRVPTRFDEALQVQMVASGLDHTVILAKRPNGRQVVYTCGINTDGQLGKPEHKVTSTSLDAIDPESCRPALPSSDADPIVGIAAGGDTSLLWTQSGRIWGWGNSEYGQALVDGEAINRIGVPTEASRAVAAAIGNSRIVDIKLGGSFVVLLDDNGDVYTAGFGPLGQGKDQLESLNPRRILKDASQIHAGLDQASAVVHGAPQAGRGANLAVWGLDSAAGRLGLGARKPYPSYMLASRFTPDDVDLRIYQPSLVQGLRAEWLGQSPGLAPPRSSTSTAQTQGQAMSAGVIDVVHGRDAMLVLLEDGIDEVGRWLAKDIR